MLTRILLASMLVASVAHAQPAPASEGIAIDVTSEGLVQVQIAIPDAINRGGVPDTRGVTEALSGTVQRDLKIAAVFNLIDRAAFLIDPAKEGMEPNFKAWFNVGAAGLVKIGFEIVGTEVTVDARLYSVDRSERVKLPGYEAPAKMKLEPAAMRNYAHGFANAVFKFYTGSEGWFLSRIVFVKRTGKNSKELFMVSPDGSEETGLTSNGSINMLPGFRGGRILFTSFKNGGPHLFSLEKGTSKAIASFEGLNTGGALSPDGSKIAVTLSKDGSPDIYLISASDGSVISKLTDSEGIDASPSWSPDGSQIAFMSDRHGSPQIWVMGASGGNARRLTFQGEYNQTPEWSPKGDKIAFTARDERLMFDVFTVEVGSGVITRVTQNQGNNEEPDWSPDGRFLVFTSSRAGEGKLFISTADGRIQNQVSQGRGEYMTPSWGR